jgi:hypothetical protein
MNAIAHLISHIENTINDKPWSYVIINKNDLAALKDFYATYAILAKSIEPIFDSRNTDYEGK